MSIFDFIKQEQKEKLDPFLLFDELAELLNEPVKLIITGLIKNYKYLPFGGSESYNFYFYDSIKGLEKIEDINEIGYCSDYLKMIVDGYKRIIFSDSRDAVKEYWGLEHIQSGDEYIDSLGYLIQYNPFYFKRSDVKSFLEYHNIPLPPCITQDTTITQANDWNKMTPLNGELTQNNSELLNRIQQLEKELIEQKKINDDFVVVPFYENSKEFLKAQEQSKNSSFNDDDFISLQKLINTITEQYRIDISETARILLIIIRKHNILMYEHSLLSGVASYSEEYNLKAKELLNLLAEGICVATKINNENYRTSIDKWDSLTHRFPLYDKIALNTVIIQDSFNEEINKKRNAIILPDIKHPNNELQQELEQANKEIEELKKIVPILLGQYKTDDLLLLAIQSRDKYWSNYTDTDPNPNYKSLSAEQIRRSIKKEFNHLSDRELNAIEFVSCPINRKK